MVTVRLAALTANKIAYSLKTETQERFNVDQYISSMTIGVFETINGRIMNDAERDEFNAIFF